jgi:methionyl-tRNA formyltransferase
VILSIRYGRILKEAVLALPPLGVLNLHSGLLPDYRGVMASFWAMLNGEKQLGTSLHYIDDASIDTGRIIAQSCMPLRSHQSYLCHVLQLYIGGCKIVIQALQTLVLGKQLKITEQQQGHYYSFPNEQAIKCFKGQGLSLVNENELIAFIDQYYF